MKASSKNNVQKHKLHRTAISLAVASILAGSSNAYAADGIYASPTLGLNDGLTSDHIDLEKGGLSTRGTDEKATGNIFTVKSGTWKELYAGTSTSSDVSGNSATLSSGSNFTASDSDKIAGYPEYIPSISIIGGFAGSNSDIEFYNSTSNKIIINGATVLSTVTPVSQGYPVHMIIGGYSSFAQSSGNLVNIKNGSKITSKSGEFLIAGGFSAGHPYDNSRIQAISNSLAIEGGTFETCGLSSSSSTSCDNTSFSYNALSLYGGYAKTRAQSNTVNISGGSFNEVSKNKIVIEGGHSKSSVQNSVTISGGSFYAKDNYLNAAGGYGKEEAIENVLTISGESTQFIATDKGILNLYGGYSDALAKNNRLNIDGGSFGANYLTNIYGGSSLEYNGTSYYGGESLNNEVNITGGNFMGNNYTYVTAGVSYTDSKSNLLNISGGKFASPILMLSASKSYSAASKQNTTTISGGEFISVFNNISGGNAGKESSEVSENTLVITGSSTKFTSSHIEIEGGCSQGISSGNEINISDGSFSSTYLNSTYTGQIVIKGSHSNNGVSQKNTVSIRGGSFKADDKIGIYGGLSDANNSINNLLSVSGGTFESVNSNIQIFGGTASVTVSGNTAKISGGTFNSNVLISGGYNTGSAPGTIQGNSVILSGDTLNFKNNDVFIPAALSDNAECSFVDNSVTLSGRFDLNKAGIYGYYSTGPVENHSGNTLNFNGWQSNASDRSEISNLGNFDVINFNDIYFDKPVTVTSSLNLDNTKIVVGDSVYSSFESKAKSLSEDTLINTGLSVTLIQAADGAVYSHSGTVISDDKTYFKLNEGQRKLYSYYYLDQSQDKKIELKTSADTYSALRTLKGSYDLSKVNFETKSPIGNAEGTTLDFAGWSSDNGNRIKSVSGFEKIVFSDISLNQAAVVTDTLDLRGTVITQSSETKISNVSEEKFLSGDLKTELLKASDGATVLYDSATYVDTSEKFVTLTSGDRKLYAKGSLSYSEGYKSISCSVDYDSVSSSIRSLSSNYDFSKIGFEAKTELGQKAGKTLTFDGWSDGNGNRIRAISSFDGIVFKTVKSDSPVAVTGTLDLKGTTVSLDRDYTIEGLSEETLFTSAVKTDILKAADGASVLFDDSTRVDTQDRYIEIAGDRRLYAKGNLSYTSDFKTISYALDYDSVSSKIRNLNGNYDFSKIGFEAKSDIGKASGTTLSFDGWSDGNGNRIRAISSFDRIVFNSVKWGQAVVVTDSLNLEGTTIAPSDNITISGLSEDVVLNSSLKNDLLTAADKASVLVNEKTSVDKAEHFFTLDSGDRRLYGLGSLTASDDYKTISYSINASSISSRLRTLTGSYDFSKIGFEAKSDIGKASGTTLTFDGWSDGKNNSIKSISGFDSIVFVQHDINNHITVTDNLDLRGTYVNVQNIALSADSNNSLRFVKGDSFYLLKSEGTFVKGDDSRIGGSGSFTIGTGIAGGGSWKQVDDGVIYESNPQSKPSADNSHLSPQEQTHGVLMSASGSSSQAIMASAATYAGAISTVMASPLSGFLPMINAGSSNTKQQTGSDVEVKAFSLAFGTGYRQKTDNFTAVYGLGAEYTFGSFKNNYDAGDAASHINNKGHIKVYGLVLSADFDFAKGWHINTAFRFGRSISTMNNALYDASTDSTYSTRIDVPYFGLALGGGYIFELAPKIKLDSTASFTYTRQNGTSFEAGGHYDLDKVDSKVLKAGEKLFFEYDKNIKFYGGLYFRHEFDGEGNGAYTASGATVRLTPTVIKGSSGIGEIGTVYTPFGDESLILDFGIDVFTGKLSGFSAQMSGKYIF